MYLLNPSNADKWLPIVEPLLHKAYDKTNVGKFVDKGALKASLSEGTNHCFVSEDLKYAGVFYVTDKAIRFWLSGGEEPIGGWNVVDEFLMSMAQMFDKPYIQLEGRLGWKRKVEPLGYEVDSLVLIKEVSQ